MLIAWGDDREEPKLQHGNLATKKLAEKSIERPCLFLSACAHRALFRIHHFRALNLTLGTDLRQPDSYRKTSVRHKDRIGVPAPQWKFGSQVLQETCLVLGPRNTAHQAAFREGSSSPVNSQLHEMSLVKFTKDSLCYAPKGQIGKLNAPSPVRLLHNRALNSHSPSRNLSGNGPHQTAAFATLGKMVLATRERKFRRYPVLGKSITSGEVQVLLFTRSEMSAQTTISELQFCENPTL